MTERQPGSEVRSRPGRRSHRAWSRCGRGYVLVTVLAAMVLLLLVASRLDQRLDRLRETTAAWQDQARSRTELASAHDEVVFRMLTEPLGPTGFGFGAHLLRVDGRWYVLPSGVRVSVQDERGLLSISNPDPTLIQAWLLQQGVTPAQAQSLSDALVDYSDLDDLRRLNGAEAEDYRRAGLPPPRNDWPISPYELRQVLGWHERPALWEHAHDDFTAVRDGWINVNTAPASVLGTLPGATTAGVQNLLRARESRHLGSAEEVLAVSGVRVPDDPVAFYPGVFYRVRIAAPGATVVMEYTHLLTPDAPALPWLDLEARLITAPEAGTISVQALPFPWARSERVSPAAAEPSP